ncbi:MAG TPA: flagellar hook-associated protein FlgK [Noviherbaspirillum sp.]
MSSSILGVGQSALNAAQTGMVTTGHNIANVNTPGYHRQVVVQSAAPGQNIGVGFIGKGTEVSTVQRVYNEFLQNQVLTSQTNKAAVDSYYAQIKQIDNLLADPTSGVSSAMQDFFEGIQDVASNPGSLASRQAMLSTAEAMAARFNSVGTRIEEMRQGVNTQIYSSVSAINNYADQIARLNDAIEKAQGTAGETKPANDLLDQRDQVISELSKEIKVTVVKQGNSYNVFMGSGQALTVGTQVFRLQPATSLTDPSRLQVAYVANNTTSILADSSLTGGRLGGLLEFRSNSLDTAQNALGRVATGLALTFNAQHQLGQTLNDTLGGAFFTAASPEVNASSNNTSAATVTASVVDGSALTTSNYRLQRVGTNFVITRLSDNTTDTFTFAGFPRTFDGIRFATPATALGDFADGDEYLIKPTAGGATGFGVAISDVKNIAAAAPIRTALGTSNTGTATISAGSVGSTYPSTPLGAAVTLTFNGGNLSASPAVAGFPQAYSNGGTISFNGINFSISGTPQDGDTFTISPNTGGVGDNRNALLLANLQTSNALDGGDLSYQTAYTHMVSQVGNKTRELDVSGKAEAKLLAAAIEAEQSESGVNLDEEAANLMRYQQAYQAAAKVMQTASELFKLLLDLGT